MEWEIDDNSNKNISNWIRLVNGIIKKVENENNCNYDEKVSEFLSLLPNENKIFLIKVLEINQFDIQKSLEWLITDNKKIQKERKQLKNKLLKGENVNIINKILNSQLCCLKKIKPL